VLAANYPRPVFATAGGQDTPTKMVAVANVSTDTLATTDMSPITDMLATNWYVADN
jgi:hypothetical protein